MRLFPGRRYLVLRLILIHMECSPSFSPLPNEPRSIYQDRLDMLQTFTKLHIFHRKLLISRHPAPQTLTIINIALPSSIHRITTNPIQSNTFGSPIQSALTPFSQALHHVISRSLVPFPRNARYIPQTQPNLKPSKIFRTL